MDISLDIFNDSEDNKLLSFENSNENLITSHNKIDFNNSDELLINNEVDDGINQEYKVV